MESNTAWVRPVYKWYNNPFFPLVPLLSTRPADEHNTPGFTFQWLFFRLWALDSLSFEIGVVVDTHWGIGAIGMLPYLRWVACIPCPEKLQSWLQRHTWRRPRPVACKPEPIDFGKYMAAQ